MKLLHLAPLVVLAACAAAPSQTAQPELRRPAELATPRGRIAGVLLDVHGQPVAGRVSLVRPGGSRTRGTGPDGSFAFDDLPLTTHTVYATRGTTWAVTSAVPAAESVLDLASELQLVPEDEGAILEPRLEGRARARLAVVANGTLVVDVTLRADRDVQLVVPPGRLSLRLYGEGLDQRRTLSLDAGETHTLDFEAR